VSSSYLEGQHNELGEFGHDRDGKKGKKQIVYGLVSADDGEPLAVKVFKGNTSDVTTLSDQIETVKKRFGVDEVVFVGDRGMIKTKGKEKLNDANFRYITALTNPQVRKLLKEQVIQISLFDENVVEVQQGPQRLILRKNPAVAAKEAARKQDKMKKLQRLIDERNDFVAQSKRAQPQAGLNRFTRWVKRYKIDAFTHIELEDRALKLTINEEALQEASMLDGCYVLITDVPAEKMDKETVDERYRDLQKLERHFRMMKTYLLEVRPIYVRKKNRTQAHVFVAMLALKVAREMDIRLKAAFSVPGREKEIMTIDDALEALARLCFQKIPLFNEHILTLPQLDEKQTAIFNALDIKPPRVNQKVA
jgi:transposase